MKECDVCFSTHRLQRGRRLMPHTSEQEILNEDHGSCFINTDFDPLRVIIQPSRQDIMLAVSANH